MWLIANYQPVGLFSLKSTLATSSGGKSLLTLTPFALKMALLDVAYRVYGVAYIRSLWPRLRDLPVAVDLSERVVVSNVFTRILKPRRGTAAPGTAHAGPLQKTIAFREYVWPVGAWGLAIEMAPTLSAAQYTELLIQLNYLGKRGGFIQLTAAPMTADMLPETYTLLNPPEGQSVFARQGVLQVLDDCSPKMTLEHANIYSGKRIRLGIERVLNHIVLPYRQVQSSKSYTLYERI